MEAGERKKRAKFWAVRRREAPKAGVPKAGVPKGGPPKGGAPDCWRFEGWRPKLKKSGAPKAGAPKGGAPERWCPRRVVPRRVRPRRAESPKFRAFFCTLPPLFSFFLRFVEFWWCDCWPRPSNVHVGVLGLSCEAPALGGPAESGGVLWRGSQGESGGAHRTDTPHHNTTTTTHHTTQRGIPHRVVLGKEGPSKGGPWPKKKQDMSNKLSRRATPLAQVFRGPGWFAKVWAQNGLIQKRGKKRPGPKVVWAKVVRAKSGQKNSKTWKKTNKKKTLPFTQNKNKMKKKKNRKTSQNQKNGKNSFFTPPRVKNLKKKSKNQP